MKIVRIALGANENSPPHRYCHHCGTDLTDTTKMGYFDPASIGDKSRPICWGECPPPPQTPAALAGETRQEARKQYLNPQQRAKWERRLEAGMDKSEDFPECTPDQRAALWTLLELKQSERLLVAAESRIAQLERDIKVCERAFQLQDAFELEGIGGKHNALQISRAWLILEKRAETAEAALTQAREVIELGKNAIILTGIADTEITGLVDKETAKAFLKAAARVY